jgi:hypothetical protein
MTLHFAFAAQACLLSARYGEGGHDRKSILTLSGNKKLVRRSMASQFLASLAPCCCWTRDRLREANIRVTSKADPVSVRGVVALIRLYGGVRCLRATVEVVDLLRLGAAA